MSHGRLRAALTAILVAAATLAPALAFAVAAVRIEVDRQTTRLDEPVTVTVTAEGEFDDLKPPASNDFQWESAGRQTQLSLFGARRSQTEVFTFVATPKRTGKLSTGDAIAYSRGQAVAKAPAVEIVVTAGAEQNGPARPAGEAADVSKHAGEPFFVVPVLSNDKPYVGEPFVLRYQVWVSTRVAVESIREARGMSADAFTVEDLQAGKQFRAERRTLGGQAYQVHTTRTVLLTPREAGSLRIDGPAYHFETGGFFQPRRYSGTAPSLQVDVRTIPIEGRPPAFREGQVGAFEVSGRLSAAQVRVGERFVLEITVKGEGGIERVHAPQLPEVPGLRAEPLPGTDHDNVLKGPGGISGTRVFQYLLAFDSPGSQTVPAVRWSAFNPRTAHFDDVALGPFTVQVQGDATSKSEVPGAHAEGTLAALMPIASDAAFSLGRPARISHESWFLALLLAPWGAVIFADLRRIRERRRQASAPSRARAQALKTALDRVAALVADASTSDPFIALREIVGDFLALRTGVRITGLTQPELRDRFARLGVPVESIDALLALLEHLDVARFAPAGIGGEALKDSASRAADVLRSLDAVLPREPSHARARAATHLLVFALAAAALLGAPHAAHAETLGDLFAESNRAYVEGHFEDARAGYHRVLSHGVESPALYYNLANTYARLDRLGVAVAYYKRALKAEPDAPLGEASRKNLALAREVLAERSRRTQTTLHVFDESPEIAYAVTRALPETSGSILLGAVNALAAGLVLTRARVRRRVLLARTALWIAVAATLVLGAWTLARNRAEGELRFGVVTSDRVELGACRGVGESLTLPEGLELRLLGETPDGRQEVRLPNGRQGCIAGDALLES